MLRVRKLMDLATNGAAPKGSDRVMVLTEPAPIVIAKATMLVAQITPVQKRF
jgi:hypothetical protein